MRSLVLLLCLLIASPAWAVYTPIPSLSTWESSMTTYGTTLCHAADAVIKNIVSSTVGPPIQITVTAHGMSNGTSVLVQNHATNTAANGFWAATVLDANTFTVAGTGNGVGGATGTIITNIDSVISHQYDYDRINAFHVAWQYTGDPSWLTCSDGVKAWWNPWVSSTQGSAPVNYGLQGFRTYTYGNLADWQRTGDAVSLAIVQNVQLNAYGADGYDLTAETAKTTELIREESNAIGSIVNAEISGYSHRTKFDDYINTAFGTNGWVDRIVGETALTTHNDNALYNGYTSFMNGAAMRGTIAAFALTHDQRTIPQIKRLMDYMWTTGWTTTAITPSSWFYRFWTTSSPIGARGGVNVTGLLGWTNPTTDSGLNHLINPANAWLYLKTLDTTYRDRHNLAFDAAMQQNQATLTSGVGKFYNQQYLWSLKGINWYNAAELALNTNARNHPVVTNRPVATATRAVTNRPAKTAWHVW